MWKAASQMPQRSLPPHIHILVSFSPTLHQDRFVDQQNAAEGMACHFRTEVIKDADVSVSFSLSISCSRETRSHSLMIFRHPCGEIHMASNWALHPTDHGTAMWKNLERDPLAFGWLQTQWMAWPQPHERPSARTTQQTCSWIPNFQKQGEIMWVLFFN